MLAYLWIAMGGALGSVGRFWFSGVVARQLGETFPWGTLLVNVSGSFLIGVLAAMAEPGERRLLGPSGHQFFIVGLCGGFTTFSTFSVQTLDMLRSGDWFGASANAGGSVVVCLVAVWVGYALGSTVTAASPA